MSKLNIAHVRGQNNAQCQLPPPKGNGFPAVVMYEEINKHCINRYNELFSMRLWRQECKCHTTE